MKYAKKLITLSNLAGIRLKQRYSNFRGAPLIRALLINCDKRRIFRFAYIF